MILKKQEKNDKIKALYDSSNVLASIYENNSNDLIIIFKSGTQYKYNNVSKSDYMRFEIAESQGKVFNTHIKKYTFEKMEDVDTSEILNEADNLKNQEKNALIEAKRLDLVNKLETLNSLAKKEKNAEVDQLFNESLIKLQTNITNYLNEINLEDGKII